MGASMLRLPSITATSSDGKLDQMQSYLYQMVEQLNWALSTVNGSLTPAEVRQIVKSAEGEELTEAEALKRFNSIKGLIIKSADIVNSYYDMMSVSLSGEYVAKSDFGDLTEDHLASIEFTPQIIDARFNSVEEVTSRVPDIEDIVYLNDSFIKAGDLYTDSDGHKVIGIEIGQTENIDGTDVFNKMARFTADGLYLYGSREAETEAAHITGQQLFITEAIIVDSIKIGGYRVDVKTDKGFLIRWEGV